MRAVILSSQTRSAGSCWRRGWAYRVTVLNRDFEIQAVNGSARIVQDDLENTYDACFELYAGPSRSFAIGPWGSRRPSLAPKGSRPFCYHTATRSPRTRTIEEDIQLVRIALICSAWVVFGSLSTWFGATLNQRVGGSSPSRRPDQQEIQSDSHIPRPFPHPFPANSQRLPPTR